MENLENIKEETLEHKIFRKACFTNITGAIKFFLYTCFAAGLMERFNLKQLIFILLAGSVNTIIGQFFISPRAIKKLTGKVSNELHNYKKGTLSEKENTDLLIRLNKIPHDITIGVAITVSILTFITAGITLCLLKPPFLTVVVTISCCILCIYSLSAKTYNETEIVVFNACKKISDEGDLDDKTVKSRKFFGASIKKKIILYSIVPFILSSLSVTLIIMRIHKEYSVTDKSAMNYFVQLAVILLINSYFIIKNSYYAQKEINETAGTFNLALEENKNNYKVKLYLPTTLNNEFAYNIYLTNQLSAYLQGIVLATNELGEDILKTTQELHKIAKASATASVSEITAVRQCFATLENLKNQHVRLSVHIEKIQKHADITKEYVTDGAELLSTLKNKMSEITQANIETIEGIKVLSEKVEKIFDLVNSIDEIAEKTTTIAYNAELGVSVAGETGEKFHIISNEIRRLASTISNSTNEIKNRIKKIQNASDNLIITGEIGAQNSTEENHIFSELERKFKELYLSSDITTESIQDIYQITEVQKESFENINELLSILNSSFERFADRTKEISVQAENLKIISESMGGVK